MSNETQRPSDLVDVSPSGYVGVETAQGQQTESARPSDLIDVDPGYVSKQINPYNTVTATAAAAGAARPVLEKIAGSDATGRRSMEQYLRTQVHHDYPGLDLAALKKEMQGMYGPKARIATYSEVQDALKAIKGQAGQPAIDLTQYETVAKPTTMAGRANQGLKNIGEVVENFSAPGQGFARQVFRTAGRGALGFGAGYEGTQAVNDLIAGNVASAIPHASSGLGYGAMLSTNPKVKGAGAVLAGLPIVGKYIGDAQAAPMSQQEVAGTGFDLASSLLGPSSLALTPSQLGAGTIQPKREMYRPGMNVLQGSTLPPQQRANGGLIYLAGGGMVNLNASAINPLAPQPINPNLTRGSNVVLNRLPSPRMANAAMGETDRQTAPGLQALIGYPR